MFGKTMERGWLAVVVTVTFVRAGQLHAGNLGLVVNGDFSQGNTGFSTQYAYAPSGGTAALPAGVYNIGTNPGSWAYDFTVYNSYGTPTGSGSMMMFNGATNANTLAWGETASVTPNTNYTFSAEVSSVDYYLPATLAFVFNGGAPMTYGAPSTGGVWQQFSTTVSSGSSTTMAMQIYDTNLNASGNDFALDDISLTPFPSVWAAAVSGSWSKAANWIGAVPNAVGAGAVFNVATTAAQTITLDAPQTLGTLLLGNSGAAGAGYTLSGAGSNLLTMDYAGAGASITVTGGAHAINVPMALNDNLTVSNSGSLTIGGVVADGRNGPMGITVTSGNLILAGSNTYSGATTISSGTVTLAHRLAVQNSTVNVAAGGGALNFAAGIINPTLGGLEGAGNVALVTVASEPVTLNVGQDGQNTTYSGNLSGAGGLTKQGPGILSLNASQNYGGPTVIAGGTLRIRGAVSVPAGATAVYNFENASGGTVPNAASPGTYDGTLQGGATVVTYPGSPSGYALSLGGQGGNSYLQVAGTNSNGIPTSAGTYTASAWFYGLYGPGYWRTLFRGPNPNTYGDHQLIIDTNSNNLGFYGNNAGGAFVGSGYSMASYNGAATWNQITVAASGGTSTYYVDGQEVGTVANASTTGIFAIGNWQGGGQVFSQYLDNVYVYNGTALNAAGVMQLYNATSTGGGVSELPTTTALSIAASATLDLGGASQQVASLSDYAPGNGGSIINSSTAASILTLSPTGGSTTFSGTIQGGGTLGAIGLVVNGVGTQVLAGSNTYTGPTMINHGELIVSGSVASPVTVNSGGILGGTGYLSNVSVSPSGQIAPGNAPQGMTVSGSLSLASSAVMDYQLDTPSTSGLLSCNTLVLSSQLEFSNFDFTWTGNFGPGTYDLIAAGSIPNGFLGSGNSGLVDGYPANLAVSGNEVVLNVVPEPSTLSFLIVGAAGLLASGRRRLRTTVRMEIV